MLKKIVFLILLVLGGIIFNNNVSAQGRTHVYAWADYANNTYKDRIIQTCRVGIQPSYSIKWDEPTYSISSDIDQIVTKLNEMSVGNKVLQIWLPVPYLNILINNSQDRVTNSNYQQIVDQNLKCNVFWDNGAIEIGKMFDLFFKKLKDKGVTVDYIMLDIEDDISNWRVSNVTRENAAVGRRANVTSDKNETFKVVLQIVKDRYGSLPAILDTIDAGKIKMAMADKGMSYIKFNSFFQDLFCKNLNTAFYYPAKKYFPNVSCSNYGSFYQIEKFKIPEQHGHKVYLGGKGSIVGTHQSPSLYGLLAPSVSNYLPGGNTGNNFKKEVSPFDAVLYGINLLKSLVIDHSAPVAPYIANRGFKKGNYRIGNSDYYQENLFHILLGGCQNILFWNTTSDNKLTDEKLVYDCVGQVDSLLNYTAFNNRKPEIKNDSIAWNNNYILSRIDIPSGFLWRLTPSWDLFGGIPATREALKTKINGMIVSNNPLTIKMGKQTIVFPTGSGILYPTNNLSLAGYWIKTYK